MAKDPEKILEQLDKKLKKIQQESTGIQDIKRPKRPRMPLGPAFNKFVRDSEEFWNKVEKRINNCQDLNNEANRLATSLPSMSGKSEILKQINHTNDLLRRQRRVMAEGRASLKKSKRS